MNDQQSLDKPLRVLFAGGGTGGHLSPGLAVAQTLLRQHPDAKIMFIGTADRIEAEKVPAAGFAFRTISAHGLAGHWTLAGLAKRLRGVLEIASGLSIGQSLRIISAFKPDVVVGTGGFVCGPVLAAARLCRLPALLLEQNEKIGLTNRMASCCIQLAAVISERAGEFFRARGIRTEVVGNPVRPSILDTTRLEGIRALGLDEARSTLSVLGGSLGSTVVNTAVSDALRTLAREAWFREGWQVLHVVGPQRGGGISEEEAMSLGLTYHAYAFLDNIHDVLAASDFIVTRAGGTFLAEIAARGVPMIIIPWSEAADDHQSRNAQPYHVAGAAEIISDYALSATRLHDVLCDILPDASRRHAMGVACKGLGFPDAAMRIVEFIEELARAKS